MYLTTHAAVGVLVAQQTHNPWLAFFGALASHFMLDFVPHGDETIGPDNFSPNTIQDWLHDRKKRIFLIGCLDLIGVVVLVIALAMTVTLPTFNLVMLGIIGSVLPDLLSNVAPVIRQIFRQNWAVRALAWLQRKTGVAFVVRQQTRFHNWIHNPWHERLPVQVSEQVGVLVQLFILAIFFATEISTLGK